MKTWIYSWIVYPILFTLAWFFSFFHKKTRSSLSLRSWKEHLSLRFNASQPIEYWIHVASQGELEYAIPILQELQKREKKAIVTYYSISAKEAVEKLPEQYSSVSLVVPLPHDGLGLMKEFVTLCRKQGVKHLLLMKYELWPGLLWECNAAGVQVFLVNAIKPSWFHQRLLHKLTGVLTGYAFEFDTSLHPCVAVVGDTRVERVMERSVKSSSILNKYFTAEFIEKSKSSNTLILASMWPEDEAIVFEALEKYKSDKNHPFLVFWVPHELDESQFKRAEAQFKKMDFQTITLKSQDSVGSLEIQSNQKNAILVMKKGILAELFNLGWFAFVGGGFGKKGVHSVWEPALAGCSVACGPNIKGSPESKELISKHFLKSIQNSHELLEWLESRYVEVFDRKQRFPIESIIEKHYKASQRIIDYCESFKFKTHSS